MQFEAQNIQPFRLEVVKITETGQSVSARLGNEAMPFHITRDSTPIHVKRGSFHSQALDSTMYMEIVIKLSPQDVDTLFRMSSAVKLGNYELYLSLPLLDLSTPVKAASLTQLWQADDLPLFALGLYDKPVKVSWWRRVLRKFKSTSRRQTRHNQLDPVV